MSWRWRRLDRCWRTSGFCGGELDGQVGPALGERIAVTLETPADQLLHAIMAGIAEFYSRNLATEALKGMTQKAKVGGTPGRAPIGYLNTRRRIEGREVRVVEVDPDRAPLVQWAFEAYATGEWTIRSLTDALAAKGLEALPHRRRVPGPVHASNIAHMLSNRYYVGRVTFKGVEYQGRHQPLVPESLFDRVQEVLRMHNQAGEKRRAYNHYLKSSIYCAHCGSRLCLTNARGKYLTGSASGGSNGASSACCPTCRLTQWRRPSSGTTAASACRRRCRRRFAPGYGPRSSVSAPRPSQRSPTPVTA